MIKARKVDEVKSVWFEWDEDFLVKIRYINKRELDKIRKKATVTTFKRGGKVVEEVDTDKFAREYMDVAILDWKGMRYKHLLEICEDIEIEEDPEKEIEYSEENKEFILENFNLDFSSFILEAVKNVLRVEKELQESGEKNLKNTSNG